MRIHEHGTGIPLVSQHYCCCSCCCYCCGLQCWYNIVGDRFVRNHSVSSHQGGAPSLSFAPRSAFAAIDRWGIPAAMVPGDGRLQNAISRRLIDASIAWAGDAAARSLRADALCDILHTDWRRPADTVNHAYHVQYHYETACTQLILQIKR